MIEQRGQVIGLEGGDAWVRIGGQSGCPACDAGEGCGAGLFGRLLNRSNTRVLVSNEARAEAGQAVVLGLEESAYLGLVLRLYGLPLVAGLAGAMLAVWLLGPHFEDAVVARDLMAASGGLVFAAAGLLLGRRHLPERFTRLSPRMLNTDVGLDCAGPGRHSSDQDTV